MGNSQSNKNVIDIIDIIEKLDKNNKPFLDLLFNLLLVQYNARTAYLLETSEMINIKDPLQYPKFLGLDIKIDPLSYEEHPRYWISKPGVIKNPPLDDEGIGHLLGMKDPGKDYFDFRTPRITLRIFEKLTETPITTEIIDDNKDNEEYAQKKVKRFNKVMKHLHLPYRFDFKFERDDGTVRRYHALLHNIEYVRDHKHEYIDDMSNGLTKYPDDIHPLIELFEKSIESDEKYKKVLPIFLRFYENFNETLIVDIEKIQKDINQLIVDFMLSC